MGKIVSYAFKCFIDRKKHLMFRKRVVYSLYLVRKKLLLFLKRRYGNGDFQDRERRFIRISLTFSAAKK